MDISYESRTIESSRTYTSNRYLRFTAQAIGWFVANSPTAHPSISTHAIKEV
ncbi:hypothetical protein RSSM_03759 [Rhodopirellula sallentina SM41]|uniref:Uncharacterized protein n=1 Tax=Rhodopirellula sallentina SM41 TaxID=1263870 RepID=M5UFM9_9BACT|nr:hypothetical protein RSSM_03759 [Rhodopirellula sallentina SM41]